MKCLDHFFCDTYALLLPIFLLGLVQHNSPLLHVHHVHAQENGPHALKLLQFDLDQAYYLQSLWNNEWYKGVLFLLKN